MLSYRRILKQAINIVWHNKQLWFFGLFASLIGFSAEYHINPKYDDGLFFNDKMEAIWQANFFSYFGQIFAEDFWRGLIMIVVLLLSVALGIFVLWLAVCSQAAIVDQNYKIDKGNKKSKLSITNGLNVGNKLFWPVLGLNLLSKVVGALAVIIITLPILLSLVLPALSAILYILLFIACIPVAVSLNIIIKYAINYLIIEGLDWKKSLKKSWKLFKKHWIISLEMMVALFLINILVALAIFLALIILISPLLLLSVLAYQFLSTGALWVIMIFGFLIILAFIAVVGAILTSFHISSWTNLFLQIKKPGSLSKLERIFMKK